MSFTSPYGGVPDFSIASIQIGDGITSINCDIGVPMPAIGGTWEITTNSALSISTSLVFNSSFYNYGYIVAGGDMKFNASSNNYGTIQQSSAKFLINATFTNHDEIINYGTITVNGTLVNTGDITNDTQIDIIGTFNNNGNLENNGTLHNTGTITNGDIITNYGTITNDNSMTINSSLVNEGTVTNNDSITTYGTYDNTGSSGITNNNGSFIVDGIFKNATDFNNDGTFAIAGVMSLDTDGTLSWLGNGVYGDWTIQKIKGEQGPKGETGSGFRVVSTNPIQSVAVGGDSTTSSALSYLV